MGVWNPEDVLKKYKYHLSNLTIKIPSEGEGVIELPTERLISLSITHNYIEYYFPIIKIELAMESDMYFLIMNNKKTAKFTVRLDMYSHDLDSSDQSMHREFLNDTFDLLMDEDTDDMEKSFKTNAAATDYTSKDRKYLNEMDKVQNNVSFYLYKADVIDKLKTNINKNINNCTVTDAIAYLASSVGANNLLMSPSQNMKIYPNMLIPPMTTIKAFSYIDTFYGLYPKGSIIYFDLKKTYIVPYDGPCSAYEELEIQNTTFIVPKADNQEHTSEPGTLIKPNDVNTNYVVADYNGININNNSLSNNVISGNSIEVVNKGLGEVKKTDSAANSKSGNQFTRMKTVSSENEFVGSTYTAQTNALSTNITMRCSDYDATVLAPNKKYQILFEDSEIINKYKKVYILGSVVHDFIKDSEDLALTSTLSFVLGEPYGNGPSY